MLAQKRNKIMYKNLFSNFFLFPIGHLTHPPTSKVFFYYFFIYMAPNNNAQVLPIAAKHARTRRRYDTPMCYVLHACHGRLCLLASNCGVACTCHRRINYFACRTIERCKININNLTHAFRRNFHCAKLRWGL